MATVFTHPLGASDSSWSQRLTSASGDPTTQIAHTVDTGPSLHSTVAAENTVYHAPDEDGLSSPSQAHEQSSQPIWCYELVAMSGRKRKQVTGAPVSFRGEFSFVNKDASNIDSKDHDAAVSWHVMNRYEKWKKSEHARKLRSSKMGQPPQDPSDVPSGSQMPQGQVSPNSSMLAYEKYAQEFGDGAYPPDPWQVDTVERTQLMQQDLSSNPVWLAGPSASPSPLGETSMSASSSHDLLPTNEYELLLTTNGYSPLITRILSFAYGVLVPTSWPDETGKSKWTYEISQAWEEIAAINNDPCYASAALCLYATLMALATNEPDLASQARFFQTQAMTELRKRVTNNSEPHAASTMKAILKLFSAETALDNTAAARIHLKMLRKIIASEGGVILLESWFRENLLSADCYFALKYETRPYFPAGEWTPGPLSQPWKVRLAAARIPNDHAPTVDVKVEDATLKSIITDLRELFKVEKYIDTTHVAPDDQLLRWRQLRKLDCISRLADHQLSVKIYPHLYVLPKLQLAICAAVALMTAMVLGSPEPVRSGQKLISDMRVKYEAAQQELMTESIEMEDAANEHVLLWILFVGRLAEACHCIDSESCWFINECGTMAEIHDSEPDRTLAEVMRRILFSPSLVDELNQHRSQRIVEARKGIYERCGMSWRQPLDHLADDQVTEE